MTTTILVALLLAWRPARRALLVVLVAAVALVAWNVTRRRRQRARL